MDNGPADVTLRWPTPAFHRLISSKSIATIPNAK